MQNRPPLLRLGILAIATAVILLLPSPATAAAGCTDRDGDGYGRSCALGADCNDSNAKIHPYADEICDGKDNDCDGNIDINVLDGESCDTGLSGVCANGYQACSGGALQCTTATTGSPEVCNGLDDDCNGKVDDGPGADADGDGFTTFCDCNDANPSVHPGAIDVCRDGIDQDCDGNVDNLHVDPYQRTYCIQFDPTTAVAGQPTPVTVRAAYDGGIVSITLNKEGDPGSPPQTLACNNQPTCQFSTTVTQSYEGPGLLIASIRSPYSIFTPSNTQQLYFTCGSDYCPPESAINDFMVWMRSKGYPECVAGKYLTSTFDYTKNSIVKGALAVRPAGITEPLTFDLYDVIPSDTEATYRSIGAGEGGNCQFQPYWPSWCPIPVPADYLFLERHFERTLGMDVNIVYHRMVIDYSDNFGAPDLVGPSGSQFYRFPLSRYTFMSQFPLHAIVHYAIQTWQNASDPSALSIGDMTGGGSDAAEVSYEPFNLYGVLTFTHEWGHTWRLPHSFDGPPSSPDFVGLDGIMDNTYRRVVYELLDPTDPTERYALEPASPDVYNDDGTFASAYSSKVAGSGELPVCGAVDPAFVSATSANPTPTDYVFNLTLTNNGTAPVGYVKLDAVDSAQPAVHLVDRILWKLLPGQPLVHRVTIPRGSVTSNNVVFTLDRSNEVKESNEVNNQVTVLRCPDADGDGYLSCVDDCDDTKASVHPGAVELCNGVDDNCNGVADEGFDADHDGLTACAGDCNDNDPRINGVESVSLNYGSCFDALDNDCDGVVDCDCAVDVSNETVVSGTVSGGLANMKCSSADDVYESVKESNSGKRVTVYWTFPNVSPQIWYDLRAEGLRSSSTGDSFDLSWTTKRMADGTCNGTETYQPCLSVIKTLDDDRLQVCQMGPPPAGIGEVEFCVRVVDSNTASSDKTADTLKLDKLCVFPILLDARALDETTAVGSKLNGTSYLQTLSTDAVYEILQEAGADALDHTWRLKAPIGYAHSLYVNGSRTNGLDGDNFQFYYATPDPNFTTEQPGTFNLITGAVVDQARGGMILNVPFGPANLAGTVWIKVKDTVPNGVSLDRLNIDYLAIKTTP